MIILGNRIKLTFKEQQFIKHLTGLHHIPEELAKFRKELERVANNLDMNEPESKLLSKLIEIYTKI